MRGYKYQSLIITIPTGTAAGIVKESVFLETIAKQAIGFNVRTIKSGGVDYVGIGLQDDNEVYVDVQSSKNFEPGSAAGLSIQEQYKEISIPADGNKCHVSVKTLAVLASDLQIEVSFLLERKDKKQ